MILILSASLSACGSEFVLFFHFGSDGNTGAFITIVIHDSDDDEEELQGATVVSGEIPLGMELTDEGTLEGTPEVSGIHEFVVEWEFADGTHRQEAIVVEITD